MNKKRAENFECTLCHFKCCKQSNYDRHLSTSKHLFKTNLNNFEHISCHKPILQCDICGKNYKGRNGLWYHKQKCKETTIENLANNNNDNDNGVISDKKLILMLIEQNKELMEIVKNGTNNTIHNNNINSHNKAFNLNFFLNETCKDAMNISDFIESVKLQVSDLENVGKVGYIQGISNIIIKNLQALEVDKRPVHCADQKREVIYVKEDNIWEKEDENNKKLRKAIRMIAHKNICMFKEFREKYPDCQEYDSKKNDLYNKIVYESMGGKGDNDYDKDTKIIKKIAKVVCIEKD
uniref:C2H2-type domain-containing protein n=1 Tax=viral metagenome TaxID=1070528 RepID=A0A6C0DJ09_9ZZZZ